MRTRFLILFAFAAAGVGPAVAGAPDRDKQWDALVAAAKAHGGVETVVGKGASYVFQRPDGSYLTITRMLDGSRRAMCLVAKDQNQTVCVDFDTGKATLGQRADAASPFINSDIPQAVAAEQPGPLQVLMRGLFDILDFGGDGAYSSPHGYWYNTRNGDLSWRNR